MVVLLAGILLLIIAMPVKKKDTEEQTQKSTPTSETSQRANYEDQLQDRLKEVLAEVKGIGKTDVFVTFEDTGRRWWRKTAQTQYIPRIPKATRSLICPTSAIRRSAAWWLWQRAGGPPRNSEYSGGCAGIISGGSP
ncbi:MAG: hypothetical protein ACLRMZ_04100 [Blautia marasmi]